MKPNPQEFHGYVMRHVASGIWHPGHTTLSVYYAEHEARDDYPRFNPPGWEPVPVVVREAGRVDTCAWRQVEDEGGWATACGRRWEFTADGPRENRMNYCMGCGRKVQVRKRRDRQREGR